MWPGDQEQHWGTDGPQEWRLTSGSLEDTAWWMWQRAAVPGGLQEGSVPGEQIHVDGIGKENPPQNLGPSASRWQGVI